MMSWGQEKIQPMQAETGPTTRDSSKLRWGRCGPTYNPFIHSQAANCAEQPGTQRMSRETFPLYRPRAPPSLKMALRHSGELLQRFCVSFCMTHLTSSIGVERKVMQKPTMAPFQKPSAVEQTSLQRSLRQNSQMEKTAENPMVWKSRGQQMPLQSCMKPQCWITWRRVWVIEVMEGSICMRTLTVSMKCPETQLVTPPTSPLAKSTSSYIPFNYDSRNNQLRLIIDEQQKQKISTTDHEKSITGQQQISFYYIIECKQGEKAIKRKRPWKRSLLTARSSSSSPPSLKIRAFDQDSARENQATGENSRQSSLITRSSAIDHLPILAVQPKAHAFRIHRFWQTG